MGCYEVIVLDTHVFIWFSMDSPSLDHRTKDALEADPRRVLVPSICLWEALMLAQKGRLGLCSSDPSRELRSFVTEAGFAEAPLTSEIALLSRTLPFEHEDPADRFIAATAFAANAKLATSDARLRRLKWVELAY